VDGSPKAACFAAEAAEQVAAVVAEVEAEGGWDARP
jgi:hypothetical protein